MEEKKRKREEANKANNTGVTSAAPAPQQQENIIDNLLKEIKEGTTLRKVSTRVRRPSRLTPCDIAKIATMAAQPPPPLEEPNTAPSLFTQGTASVAEPVVEAAASLDQTDGLQSAAKRNRKKGVTLKLSNELSLPDGEDTSETPPAAVVCAPVIVAQSKTESGADHPTDGAQEHLPPAMVETSSNHFKPQTEAVTTTKELLSLELESISEEATHTIPVKPKTGVSRIGVEQVDTSIMTGEEPTLKLRGELPKDNPDVSIKDPNRMQISDHNGSVGTKEDGEDDQHHRHVHFGLELATSLMLIAVPSAVVVLTGNSEHPHERKHRRHSFQLSFRRRSSSRRPSIPTAQHQSQEQARRKISLPVPVPQMANI